MRQTRLKKIEDGQLFALYPKSGYLYEVYKRELNLKIPQIWIRRHGSKAKRLHHPDMECYAPDKVVYVIPE